MDEWLLVLDAALEPRSSRPSIIGPIRPDRPLTVGRDAGCDFVLDSREFPGLLSRVHATLRLEDGVPVLNDSSLNGCGVDGGRKAKAAEPRAALREGAKVIFGVRGSETEFVYGVTRRRRGDQAAGRSPAPPSGSGGSTSSAGHAAAALGTTIAADSTGEVFQPWHPSFRHKQCGTLKRLFAYARTAPGKYSAYGRDHVYRPGGTCNCRIGGSPLHPKLHWVKGVNPLIRCKYELFVDLCVKITLYI